MIHNATILFLEGSAMCCTALSFHIFVIFHIDCVTMGHTILEPRRIWTFSVNYPIVSKYWFACCLFGLVCWHTNVYDKHVIIVCHRGTSNLLEWLWLDSYGLLNRDLVSRIKASIGHIPKNVISFKTTFQIRVMSSS